MMRYGLLLQSVVLIWICFMCLPFQVLGENLPEEELKDLFRQGKEFFHQGNEAATKDVDAAKGFYKKAAMRFERIVREGNVRNGKLYYNIGNVYFRMGDLGKAILNYRRAQRYLPNDHNLRQNLEYARSRRHDDIEEKQQTKVLKTLLFWHYDLSKGMRSVVFVVSFALFWLGLSVRLFLKKAMPRWPLACLGVIAVIFFCSLIYESTMAGYKREGVILDEEVVARKGDGETYQPSFKDPLHTGTEFRLVLDRDTWYQIELHDGRRCWIPGKGAQLIY